MNPRISNPDYVARDGRSSVSAGTWWLRAVVMALLAATFAAAVLPGALVLPATAMAMFGVSIVSMLIATLHGGEELRGPRLFAAITAFLAIAAAVLTDSDRLVPYLR